MAGVELRKFGIDMVGNVSWGTHLCQFYETKQDLIDILVPYFAEGLRNNEFCMWITSQPLEAKEAKEALGNVVPNFEEYIKKGQIEILPYTDWYLAGGEFSADRILEGWVQREKDALGRGFDGLRLTGNTFWIERYRWKSFVDYEARVNDVIKSYRMIALCTYPLERCTGSDIIEVLRNHRGALIRAGESWNLIEDVVERKKTEEELRDSEEKFRRIVENSQDVIMLTRPDGVISYLSPSCLQVLGYNPEELVGGQPWIIHPDDLEKVKEVHSGALQGRNGSNLEYRIVTKAGETRWVSHSWSPIITNGQVQLIVSTVRGITERKKSEEAVQEARQNYDALFNNKSVGLAYCKVVMNERNEPVDFVFLDVNDTHEVLTGLKRADVVGKKISEVIPGFAQSEIDWRNNVALTGEDAHREIYEPHLKRWYDVTLYSPRKGYFVSIFTDISGRKNAEEALRQSSSLLHSFFDSPGAMRGIVEVVDGTQIRHIAANPLVASFYRLPLEAVRKGSSLELGDPPEIVRLWIDHYEQSRLTGGPVHFEYLDKRGDREVWLSATVSYLGTTTDGKRRFGYVATDITDRKKAEEQIVRLASFPTLNPNLIVEVDFDGTVHYINPAAKSILPDLAESGVNHPFLSDWKNIVFALQVENNPRFIREVRIGNDWFHQQFFLVPETLCVRVYAMNVNELKRTESELQETRDFLDNLLNYANAPIIVWDPQLKITKFNHAFERLTGLSSDDVVGKPLDILFPEDKKEEAMSHIHRTIAGEYWETVEIPVVHVDGRVRTLLWNSANIRDRSGRVVIATIAQGQDITHRKQAEDELRKTRDYLDSLLNYANAPIIVWDPDFRITRFNRAFERLTGLSSDDVVGKPLDILFPEDRKEEALEYIRRTLAGEYWETVEIPILHTDGTVKTVLWNSANIHDPATKSIIATIAQGHDITERKKLEERLRIAERFSAIGQTAAMVSHDLRNPLQATVGFVELAEEYLNRMNLSQVEKQEFREKLRAIKDQTRYMNKIVTDLQDYAQPIRSELVRTDVNQLIKETLRTSDIPEKVAVSVRIPKSFPKMKIDPAALKRVLINLIVNAVQAMPNGGELNLRAFRKTDPTTLIISVEDTGIGISRTDRQKIFTPLFTTKSKGQGFGLPACKRLLEAQGGTITFRSRVGHGSRFTITIPLTRKG